MKKYKSHKTVEAFKIVDIVATSPVDLKVLGMNCSVEISGDYVKKHDPHRGGYYVRYQDGYESFSPAEAFEDGYAEIGKESSEPKNELDYGQLVNLRMECLKRAMEIHSAIGYDPEKSRKEELIYTTEELIKIALGD